MAYLKIHSKRISIDVNFKYKYIFIQGDSGIGKSLLVDLVSDEEFSKKNIDTDLKIRVLNKYTMDDFSSWDNGELIISDEIYIRSKLDELKGKNCYALIITRKIFKNINFSYKCLYEAFQENGVIKIKQMYKPKLTKVTTPYDLVITEDAGYGYTFIKECLNGMNVVGAGGKSNIATMISSKYKEGYKSMLIIVDGGGLGSDIGSIVAKMRKVRNRGCDTFVLLPECFEEVLLCSDYIGYTEEELLNEFKAEYGNTENYCELKLLEVTKGTVIECNHKSGYMSECWIKQCSNCNQDCSKRTNVEKFKYVLSNGPLKYLLNVRR